MAEVFNGGSIDFSGAKAKRVNFQAELPADKQRSNVVKNIERDGGRYVAFGEYGDSNLMGILVAGVEIGKQVKYAYIDKNRELAYVDAGEKYRMLRDIPSDLSVLSYLWSRERNGLVEKTMEELERMKHVEGLKLVTPIGIRKYEPRTDNRPKRPFNKDKRDNKR